MKKSSGLILAGWGISRKTRENDEERREGAIEGGKERGSLACSHSYPGVGVVVCVCLCVCVCGKGDCGWGGGCDLGGWSAVVSETNYKWW